MIYSKIKITILAAALFTVSACTSKYNDYSIHKPKVKYKPTTRALDKLRNQTMWHPYVWGAENDGCYDCSGLTYYTLGSMGVEIPRVANDQFHSGTPISKSELQKGDLVFFQTSKRRPGIATHVGIYLGDDKFQHASSAKQRVMVSSLSKPYWVRTYLGARRYYNFDNNKNTHRYGFAPTTPQYTKEFKPQVKEELISDNVKSNNAQPQMVTDALVEENPAVEKFRGDIPKQIEENIDSDAF